MVYIKKLSNYVDEEATLKGWVYNYRSSKNLYFIELRDGTGICQCVVTKDEVSDETWQTAESLTQESSLAIMGKVVEDKRSEGGYELQVSSIKVIQIANNYPITPKEHGVDFLMENRHLWLRSQRQWAAMRIRSEIVYAIHTFFQQRGFIQTDAPVFTGNAAEGTTSLFATDFFDDQAYLTQSGQLYAEATAMAHGLVYTFGPTFRAEKSKTRRHLAEFWMIEPEMAFYDLQMNMDLAEEMVKAIIQRVLENCKQEIDVLERDTKNLQKTVESDFPRISYSEAVEILKSDETSEMLDQMAENREQERIELDEECTKLQAERGQAKKGRKTQIDQRMKEIAVREDEIEEDLRNIPGWKKSASEFEWGTDFGGSDETILTMQYEVPVHVHRFPAQTKAFYMKRDPEDDSLALACDMLAPEGYGEIIGGSQREDNLDDLLERIHEHNLSEEVFSWYIDLRKYGTVPHSGFGLGLERMVAWLCGLEHVRETIPFPRMMGRLTP
jgi:asparaginyl-tRNA synthetase